MDWLTVTAIAFCVFAVCAAGAAIPSVTFNKRPIPNRPLWWPIRGLVVLLVMVCIVVLLPLALVHDAVWPWGRRWVKWSSR